MLKMKSNKLLKLIVLFLVAITVTLTTSARDYYQLKVYKLKDKNQEAVIDSYLENAYLPALHRAGIQQVGVFKPIDSGEVMKIIVFIPLKNMNQVEELETTLSNDKKFQTDGSDYINASWENPPYERMESIILKSFSEMPEFAVPNHSTPSSDRIYELRSYEGPTERYYRKKVKMFNEGGEITIFNTVGSQPVFFAEVISGSTMPNLMYLTTYSDMKSHDEHWDAFRNHPDWKRLSSLPEYEHTVSKAVVQLMHPTEYSDL